MPKPTKPTPDTAPSFSPIAIVGRGCVLPGALDPDALWRLVEEGRCVIEDASDEDWAIGPWVDPRQLHDAVQTRAAGLVRGFELDPALVEAGGLEGLDPLVHWIVAAGRQALDELQSKDSNQGSEGLRAGLVMGNLSYPTASLNALALERWRDPSGAGTHADPRDRFMSGLPAQLAANALGLDAGGFCLDAACASSLYAIELACRRLHAGEVDLMLAGGVNHADDLFLHLGFRALRASSPSGRSRPFHAEADGLVPAHGAAVVALRRLDDALARGERVLAVIRGVGLSNDGRAGNMMAPKEDGQTRAMRAAYAMSGVDPARVSYVECHATGTPVGDKVELRSMREVFATHGPGGLAISSLKANMGHLITASGAASVLKVIAAMHAQQLPATPNLEVGTSGAQSLNPELGGPLRVLVKPEAWVSEGPRVAAVSNFGFGGNNAHLVLESWDPDQAQAQAHVPTQTPVRRRREPVAVVAQALATSLDRDGESLVARLFPTDAVEAGPAGAPGEGTPGEGAQGRGAARDIELTLGEVKTPPVDLRQTLPQQLGLLRLALDLRSTIEALPGARTGLFAGMQCDAEIARTALRYRHDFSGRDEAELPRGAGDVQAPLVLGCMPNVVANRISAHFDLRGPCFSVSAEQASGTVALELALDKLGAGDIDAALVAAVDLSREPVHAAAAAALLPPGQREPSDGAVLLVLERLSDARRRGAPILAILESGEPGESGLRPSLELTLSDDAAGLSAELGGHSHAASGLLHVAALVAACGRRALPPGCRPLGEAASSSVDSSPAGTPLAPLMAVPWLPGEGRRSVRFTLEGLAGVRTRTTLTAPRGPALPRPPSTDTLAGAGASTGTGGPQLAYFSGEDLPSLQRDLAAGRMRKAGPVRLAVVAKTREALSTRLAAARLALAQLRPETTDRDLADALPEGVYFRRASLVAPPGVAPSASQGELAFVFTGPASAYPNMGREIGLAFPELLDAIGDQFASLHDYVGWIYAGREHQPSPAEKLWASSYLIQLHAKLSREVLGMKPQAAIGYCAGESNALFAMGAWQDFESLARDIHACDLYTRELGGDMQCAKRAWGLPSDAEVQWATLRVLAPVATVRDALSAEPRVHLTMLNSPHDVVIAGEAQACARVIERVGVHRARSIGYDFIMHCPEAREFEAGWRALHLRPTSPIPGLRFYSHAHNGAYELSEDAVADALVGQAMGVVDFPALIEQAYADGVRVFVEHGPLSGCSKWISATLGDRPHLSVPLDRYRESSLNQLADTSAQLFVAGVELDIERVRQLGQPPTAIDEVAPAEPARPKRVMRYPLHWEPVHLPDTGPPGVTGPGVTKPGPGVTKPGSSRTNRSPPTRSESPGMQTMRPAPVLGLSLRGLIYERGVTPPARPVAVETQAASARPSATPARPLATPVPARPGPASARRPAAGKNPVSVRPRSLPQTTTPGPLPSGPRFDRAQLEVHASGAISTLFGPGFAEQDRHKAQVRMPCPPLLLADRVTGITGEPGTMGLGTCWTETDVREDSWYLHEGRMPAGIFVESGQADLFLISWLGADLLNQGERVYRLLGCELTSYGPLPKVGDTLVYDIYIDGHAAHGDVRLFFFHYDCRINGEVRISVRNGQAGFFTYDELDNSAGVLWDPEEGAPSAEPQLDPGPQVSLARAFDPEAVAAFTERRLHACFGEGFERAQVHTRSPAIAGGAMCLVERVTHFLPPAPDFASNQAGRAGQGGPWGRGYLRATLPLERDSWFYAGHFHNDPCMPGTLMFEGGIQAMALYMSAMGCTLDRDGWRFEPVDFETWKLSCRGQAVPGAKEMVYEIFVDEFIAGPQPTLFATMLGSVDGRKAFLCPRIGLRLVPSWPMEGRPFVTDPGAVASTPTPSGPFALGRDAMLACAWGKPSRAFGPLYKDFDGGRKVPRLPGPPYHFMTYVESVRGTIGAMEVGSTAQVVYEVPAEAWYFDDNRNGVMPFSVLLEIALQPCGWLASYCGFAAAQAGEVYFRNLDGKRATVHAEVPPDAGVLTTEATMTSASVLGSMVIVGFEVEVRASFGPVYSLSTVFGFFPGEALANQAGLPTTDAQRASLVEACPSTPQRVPARIEDHLGGAIADGRLATLDRVTGLWPQGGAAGLGRIRAERSIDPSHWYFKAHFFQDSVQPGSIGIDAMLQALRLLAVELELQPESETAERTRFEVAAPGVDMTWKYRGQVVPTNGCVVVDIEVSERRGDLLVGRGSLWVDGKRIYEADGLSVRAR